MRRVLRAAAFAGATVGGQGTVILVTNDEAGTRSALAAIGASVREIELVTVGFDNHPGTLAETARKIADAGISIVAAMPTGMSGGSVHVGFGTSDPAKTPEILGDRVMTAAMG